MTMPAMPGSALVVIEPELVFRGFKTILDRPPMALDRDQRFDRCSRWTPGGKEGHVAVDDATTDQQTTCPQTIICAAVFLGLKIGEFDRAPIMQSRPLGSSSPRQTLPIGRVLRPRDVFGLADDRPRLPPGSLVMRAAYADHTPFTASSQSLL